MRDCCLCTSRVGEEVERHIPVVADGRERGVGVGRCRGVARDGNFQQKQPRDRSDDDGMFGERIPK